MGVKIKSLYIKLSTERDFLFGSNEAIADGLASVINLLKSDNISIDTINEYESLFKEIVCDLNIDGKKVPKGLLEKKFYDLKEDLKVNRYILEIDSRVESMAISYIDNLYFVFHKLGMEIVGVKASNGVLADIDGYGKI